MFLHRFEVVGKALMVEFIVQSQEERGGEARRSRLWLSDVPLIPEQETGADNDDRPASEHGEPRGYLEPNELKDHLDDDRQYYKGPSQYFEAFEH